MLTGTYNTIYETTTSFKEQRSVVSRLSTLLKDRFKQSSLNGIIKTRASTVLLTNVLQRERLQATITLKVNTTQKLAEKSE